MYKIKLDLDIDINKTKASKQIGISRVYLTDILNGKKECSKIVAFCITKYLDKQAEIESFFDRIGD